MRDETERLGVKKKRKRRAKGSERTEGRGGGWRVEAKGVMGKDEEEDEGVEECEEKKESM